MSSEERMYKCPKCGKEFSKEEMEILPGVKCPYCGWRIVVKLRPPVVKTVKAI
ncbi:MAG: DNA-directed RNA polymerase subunit P [Thermoproteales archaeon]|nr:DNA-directed RNA polymerase subunit P [Thermoproteales archaeon]